ncbi:MAG: PP2C family protein-serine/threonine phosphatase [Terracidiphilus sp.]
MRKTIFGLAAVALCCALQLGAQTAPPHHSALHNLLHPQHQAPPPSDAAPTPVTIIDATSLGSPLVLDKGWRVGNTADRSAANPTFDDSAWAVRNATESFADVPDQDQPNGDHPSSRSAKSPKHDDDDDSDPDDNSGSKSKMSSWFRLHIQLAPNHGPIALLIELPVSKSTAITSSSSSLGVDVFANGKPIRPEGPHGDAPEHYQPISRIYNLNISSDQTSLTLVLRSIYIPVGLRSYTSFFNGRTLRLGNPADLNRSLELWYIHSLFERLPRLVNAILLTVLALFLLALFFTQKGHNEYLWLALYELVQAPIGYVDLAGSSALIGQIWYAALVLQLAAISGYLYFEFLIAFLALRRRWYILLLRWTAPILAGIAPGLLLVGHSAVMGVLLAVVAMGSLLWILGWMVFIFTTLIVATIKRNFEAGLLLIPLLLSLVGIIEPILTAAKSDWGGVEYHSPLTLQAGPIPIHFASIADFTGILVIVLIIFVRFLRIHRDQERVSSELAAARSVQELMIPHEQLLTPGFEVDSVYNPATEVGGDFFHVQPTSDGGLLVVIGDVAGHGLKAAMNVSMLMGAMRRTAERSPAKILESLNRVLTGSESFTTCQAAFFAANGEVVLSNAGHLPPYLNSQEVNIPGGLPLGVLADNTYEEIRLYLHPGDRLLLMSDGVVEARHPNGELFGFDRVHNLSNQTAFYIADSAKTFGQEDDITVLTVRRLAQAMAA